MQSIPQIKISEYNYALPSNRIAQFPVAERDESKLLVWKDGKITDSSFKDITAFLPDNAVLISNETKVVQSRLFFRKETGALIELFLLEPIDTENDIHQAFTRTSGLHWKCMVGNSKKWKGGFLTMKLSEGEIKAYRMKKEEEYSVIEFTWTPENKSFSEIVEEAGIIPLPPYMSRQAEESDKSRYQTIFARNDGSVAAPTAGLHFTQRVLDDLKRKKITHEKVTLHVGAGTFKPVGSDDVREHEMHAETIIISRSLIEKLLHHKREGNSVVAVGTTSTRSLESLYWLGLLLKNGIIIEDDFFIDQWMPYDLQKKSLPSSIEVLEVILKYMKNHRLNEIRGKTRIIIVPGYEFKIIDVLITNFHLPKSTLLLLVSALIGGAWKKAYQHALEKDYRFLSYGDACLFNKKQC